MAPKSFYAVRKGRNVGIYHNWDDCKRQVDGYPTNEYKKFSSLKEAEDYLLVGKEDLERTSQIQDIQRTQTTCFNQVLYSKASPPAEETLKSSSESKRLRKRPFATNTSLLCADSINCKKSIPLEEIQNPASNQSLYRLEFDGASKGNPGKAGAGAVLRNPEGSVVCTLREGVGVATNNIAEYRALIRGLKVAASKGIDCIHVQGDSNLVCMQIQDKWKTTNKNILNLSKEAKELKRKFKYFQINHIPREFNSEADALANAAIEFEDGEWLSSEPDPKAHIGLQS